MLVSLFALRSTRGRKGDRRPGAARLAGAPAQDCGRQARGRETVHQSCRHYFDLSRRSTRQKPEETIASRQIREALDWGVLGQGGNVMTNTKALMRSACVGAILAATGMSGASAQQTIAAASATPGPGPMPEIPRAYAPVTPERLKTPDDAHWLTFPRTFPRCAHPPRHQIN